MQLTLELSGHPKANVQRVVLVDTALVGRSRVCGLQIASPTVSRKHCEIRLSESDATVIDLGSANGTFIDSERIPAGEERPLPPGCRLNIGGVRFSVSYEEAAAPGTPKLKAAATAIDVPDAEIEDEPLAAEAADDLSAAIAAADAIVSDPDAESDDVTLEPPSDIIEPAPSLGSAEEDDDETPILEEESLLDDEPILADSGDDIPGLGPDASLGDDDADDNDSPLESETSTESGVTDEPDLSELFAESEPTAQRSSHDMSGNADELAAEEEDEPIIEQDEDAAFSFLTDDDASGPNPSKHPEDSRLGDFLSQLGRD